MRISAVWFTAIGVVASLASDVLSDEGKSKPSSGAENIWVKSFEPPEGLTTKRIILEPLKPEHAELDHAAIVSNREHLQRTLQWGDWPAAGMTVKENRKDLERHWREFQERQGYAYTVLSADRKRCVGCFYMKPAGGAPRKARIAYWVVEDELENDLDRHLVESLLEWFKRDWPLEMVAMPLIESNGRGVSIAKDLKLVARGPARDGRVQYFWRRNGE